MLDVQSIPLSVGITGEYGPGATRELMKNGRWIVPVENRPQGWEKIKLAKSRAHTKAAQILALHEQGMGCVKIGLQLGLSPSSVDRLLRKRGVERLPRNGSHRRVDVCACGSPALERGSKCADCDRKRKSEASKNSYRRRNNVAPEKWRVA